MPEYYAEEIKSALTPMSPPLGNSEIWDPINRRKISVAAMWNGRATWIPGFALVRVSRPTEIDPGSKEDIAIQLTER